VLIKIKNNNIKLLLYNIKVKLNINKTLNYIQTRFFKLNKFTNLLDLNKKERLLKQ
jgi:hypothetical protein